MHKASQATGLSKYKTENKSKRESVLISQEEPYFSTFYIMIIIALN